MQLDHGCLMAFAVLSAACSGPSMTPQDAPKSCPIGDLTSTPEIELFQIGTDGTYVVIKPMDTIPLLQPPQGGWVFYIAAHARNVDGCQLQLKTSLQDVCTNQVVTLESRAIVLEDDGTGWGVPINQSNDGLVAACPQIGLSRDLTGEPYLLRVVVTDSGGRHAEASVQVVPVCSDPYCLCQCGQNYHLGDNCASPADAGVSGCP
ncbi:MAG: hypothetical protein JWO36_4451 [Myxococcales bacterium]|nr:hypothetical protein [Myxococcales bacterium]